MNLTEEMLDIAMRKAVEAGLLPRDACREDRYGQRELIRYILQATLETAACSRAVHLRGMPGREFQAQAG